MKTYEAYKKAKFNWINEIPSHWKEGKIKYIFDIGRGRVISQLELKPDGKYPVYSSQTKNDGCLGYIDTYDFEDNLLTWTTDGANAGEVFKRSGRFNCTNVCGTLKPVKEIDLKYYLYLLQFLTPFYKRPDTNGAKIMNGEMAEIACFILPTKEQTQIAKYLNHKTQIIDALIEKKEQLIKKLQAQRQAIINEAVTKGLNPNANMKDSGIEWLGEIPEHWSFPNVSFVAQNNRYSITGGPFGSDLKQEEYTDEGVRIIQLQNIGVGEFRNDYKIYTSEEKADELISCNIYPGELIIAKMADPVARACIVPSFDERYIMASDGIRFEVNQDKCLTKFLEYSINSKYFNFQAELKSTGTTRLRIGLTEFKKFKILLPDLKEQEVILAFIEEKGKIINRSVKLLKAQIKNLKAYRQSLISEAVTGKIDVRDWQSPTKN